VNIAEDARQPAVDAKMKCDAQVFMRGKRRENFCGLFDLARWGRYRLCFSLSEILPLGRRSTYQKANEE
jgi:hypothetical protein